MRANVGDRLIIKGHTVGSPDRDAEILEVRGPGGSAPFVVRWSDSGHETLFFPGPDAAVQHFGTSDEVATGPGVGDVMRAEHRALFAAAHRMVDAADQLDDADVLPDAVHEAYAWLVTDVMAHAHVEERSVYPVVADLLHAPAATDPMRRQHTEIDRLVHRLGALRAEAATGMPPSLRRNLRQVLYGLHAILTLHLATEEELYVPLLEGRLTPARSEALAIELRTAEEPPEIVPVLR